MALRRAAGVSGTAIGESLCGTDVCAATPRDSQIGRHTSASVELLVEIGIATDQRAEVVELRGCGSVLVVHDEGADPLRRFVQQERAGRVERLELVDPLPHSLDRGAPLVEPPEEDPDDHAHTAGMSATSTTESLICAPSARGPRGSLREGVDSAVWR